MVVFHFNVGNWRGTQPIWIISDQNAALRRSKTMRIAPPVAPLFSPPLHGSLALDDLDVGSCRHIHFFVDDFVIPSGYVKIAIENGHL